MNNIYILNKNYSKIGTLSNEGARPQAPYYEDLFVQELETGADTYQFSTMSTPYTQDLLEIGNHIMFAYKNRNELFTITSLEYSHSEGYKTIGVYAEGLGFELLEIFMKKPDDNSGGGTDNDNDGDDNYDDEYADVDDIYIDANGNIIYDRDGSGLGNVTVDGNGNIIYKRSKNNRKNDSLEFKNISYPTFLNVLLKNTSWSFVCQPGLESIKHDITVRYDTNIYAILQDSMQDYRGVELEFVYEYNNGNVKKTVKAYKDGGRGSFVGKRFEYGTNVKGITKTQEVTNSEDDTILYVDNVGVDVRYDVDFALKSAEVPEIEIGDTHYVIDKDFYPPMTIKARIGKIEVSFSDPTRNKIYLANNKKIRGSAIEEGVNEDDIKDIMDDYDYDSDYVPTHYHDMIRSKRYTETSPGAGSYEVSWSNWYVKLDKNVLYGNVSDTYHLGSAKFPWNFAFTNTIINKDNINSPKYWGHDYQKWFDREDMEGVKKITNSSSITKQDLLNFVMNDLNIYEYSSKAVTEANNYDVEDETALFSPLPTFGLLSEDMVSEYGKTSKIGGRLSRGVIQRDTNNDGDENTKDDHYKHSYDTTSLLCLLIGAFQQHVSTGGGATTNKPSDKNEDLYYKGEPKPGEGDDSDIDDPDNPGTGGDEPDNPGTGDTPSNPGTGGGTITDGFDIVSGNELFVNKIDAIAIEVAKIEVTNRLYVKDIVGTSISQMTTAEINAIKTGIIDVGVKAKIKEIEFPDGSTLTTANGAGSGTPSSGNIFDTITVRKIQGPDPGEGQYNRVEFEDGIGVSHIFCNSEDENDTIFIGDHVSLHAGMTLFSPIVLSEEDGYIEFPDGSRLTSANGIPSSGSGSSSTDNITASKIVIGAPTDNKASKCSLAVKGNALVEGTLYIEGSYTVNGTSYSDKSLKENIRYIDTPTTYSDNSLLEKADLHDFIVNQVNICEYNFIDDDRNKIGFIANDYEDTKVGDKIVFRNEETDLLGYDSNNLLFATIGALQEEVRIRDEKIATLEDRLATIEAMLGINNDN